MRYRKKKIFRPKRRYKIKRRNDNIIKLVVCVCVVGILFFVGYSIAGPVSSFIEERARQSEEEQYSSATDDTSYMSPDELESVQKTDYQQEISNVTDSSQSDAQQSVPAAPQDTAAPVQTTAPDNEDSAPQIYTDPFSESFAVSYEISEGGAAYSLTEEELADIDLLKERLAEIRGDGYSAVIFPMKTQGGTFHYATAIPLVATCVEGEPAVDSDITAGELAQLAESYGLRPAASISVLYDNNRYGDYRDGSYRSLDGSTWLDTSPEKGGKPWLSPFDETAKQFCCDIVTELAEAGFAEIICYDFVFPEFRTSDIELLGDEVSVYNGRYKAITELAQLMTKAGENSGAQVMLRITANSIIKDYSELYVPERLQGCTMLVDYSENNMSRTMVTGSTEVILDEMNTYDKVTAVFSKIAYESSGMYIVPMLEASSMSADDYNEAVKALSAMGYTKYYIY